MLGNVESCFNSWQLLLDCVAQMETEEDGEAVS